MSRIGKKPIEIPSGVEITIDGQTVTAKGPLGTETVVVRPEIAVKIEDNHIILSKVGQTRETDALFGLSRTLVANAVHGVKEGFEKKLESQGRERVFRRGARSFRSQGEGVCGQDVPKSAFECGKSPWRI